MRKLMFTVGLVLAVLARMHTRRNFPCYAAFKTGTALT
jgi:hypothetical protein